ncbi:UDP-glycosyltransferase UGT5-like [Achroia grisella]|uniref:UDP-glycosyltransferase UGT5-like n=1 Tax=Achroia grisella TaxID=688607 RepID=UPI0027D26051|nr:UDP-glycosyltransferase UGT5-like [Achroia grisella]
MVKLTILLILLLISILSYVCSYKILVVFPYPGKSHTILGNGYVRHLLKAGHEVTYITSIPIKNTNKNLRQIDVSSNIELFTLLENLDLEKQVNKVIDLEDTNSLLSVIRNIANNTLHNKNVRTFIEDPNENFDAVIVEWLYTELYCGFATVFDSPLIWSSSMDPHSMVLSLIDEDPNPAYTSNHISHFDPPFTFTQRLNELWTIIDLKILRWWLYDIDNKIFADGFTTAAAKRGRTLPSLYEAQHSGVLMLGNSHVSSGKAMRLPQNYKPIAGYHIDDEVRPLPEDLQKIMDDAKQGVIYFSLGSMVKSKSMPSDMKSNILKMFSALKQTVIWKFEEVLPNLPKNVHILEWAPQQSILAHKNCILFITHGGLLSTTEALHFGVPLIGVPIFADQHVNIYRAVNKGFARHVPLNKDMAEDLKEAIDEILGNPKYKEKVRELSFVHHDRPISPGDELVHWVEHVIRTKGAPHLRSPAFDVPFYQKCYLDLAALVLAILIAIKIIIVKLVRLLFKKPGLKKKIN